METQIQTKGERIAKAQEALQGEILTSAEVEAEIRKDYKRKYIN